MNQPTATNGTSCDVAIIGGGPGGSTLGTLLRKYNPSLKIKIFEKEKFPRDHIGESQLPPISDVLVEMGCWDKVEAANFPIKVGATFRWGKSPELWDFEFLPLEHFKDEPRPAKYEGQRKQTAFQVDRSLYDEILLRHAEESGCEVREETQVTGIEHEGDRVTGIKLRNGEVVTARYYVDASGHVGIMRRAMGVNMDIPTSLQNIAIWDYWNNTEWAVKIGVGGTRIQVMTVGFGWIWFIPIQPTRTSLGLVCPAEYYKKSGKTPEELYQLALKSEPRIAALITNATRRGRLETTKDWSFVSERTFGENWFLVGEAAGFADPILSAGLTLTHTGARELAYVIMELDRGDLDAAWLKEQYDITQRARVTQHIRFADYWYACNGQLTDLQAHCQKIAKDAGLNISPQSAWRWLAQGGFTQDVVGQAGLGGLDLAGVKQITQIFTQKQAKWLADGNNVFKLDLAGAQTGEVPVFASGRIVKTPCYIRGEHRLPITGMFQTMIDVLKLTSDITTIRHHLMKIFRSTLPQQLANVAMDHAMQAMELLVSEGWVTAKLDKKRPVLRLSTPTEGQIIHSHRDAPLAKST